MADLEVVKNNLEALERVMACLNAQEEIIGKGTIGVLYQAGRDVGQVEGKQLDRSDDVTTAIRLIDEGEKRVWNVEIWNQTGSSSPILEEDGYCKVQVVFRECPIRQVCITQGVRQDGAMCRLAYGYYAGLLSSVMSRKVDLRAIEVGPNACKKEIRWRKE
jgi:predicted hydrocarbon binding protein